MTHNEQRKWLISYLLKEDQRYAQYQIPEGEKEQKDLLRALMNVRMPSPISHEFIQMQDAYLTAENEAKGIVDVNDLTPCIVDDRLYLWQGDMARLNADAVVNPANSALLGCFSPLHSCLDNILGSAAGIELRAACYDYVTGKEKELHLAPGSYEEPTGQAMITPAFNLPAKYVIHTVGPIVNGPLNSEHKKLLASCYTSVLGKADENGLESIALCCISTGVFMFPQDKAAEIAVKTVRDWLMEHPNTSLKKVIFNVFKDKDVRLYDAILNKQIRFGR